MKPFAILLLANISFPVFAQDYLITFTGSGASTTVDSVKVENLSQCTSLSMAGSDTLLLQTVVGMDEVSDGNDFSLRISPNPSPGVLTVSITTSINCNTILSVFDLSGKILLSREEGLARGCNTFVLTGIPAGFYFLTAGSGRSLQKVTFISTAAGAGTPGLHRIGSESGTVKDHPVSNNPAGSGYRAGQAVVTMQFNPGDTLKLTGRSGIYRTVSMLFPTSSQTVTFSFVGCTDTDSFIRPWPLYAEDLDGDQDYDIIVGSSHAGSNQVHWWRNDSITGSDSTDRIAFSITAPDGYADIFLINADGSGKNQLTNQPERPYGPAFSPDAEQIAFYNHFDDQTWHLYIMNANGADISQLTNQQNVLDWSPDWSPDGSKIVFARSYAAPVWRSEIWLINPDGSDLHPLGSLDGQGPDWSPDGLKIVYFNYVEGGGDIWIANADGTNPIKLTDDPAEDWWPKFSPDGNKIAFQSRRDGNFEIYVMDSDGSNLTRITNNSADDEDPNWSPDGEKIAFISMRDGHYEIYTMNVDGSDQTRITTTDGQAVDPDWKPVITLTSVEENGESWNALPKNFRLFQNYPNPFNPATRIDFEIIEPGFATLRIYNLFGQEVDKLINKHMPKGVHSVDWNCMNLPGGVYYYRLSNHLGSDTKKMVITD